MSISKPTISAAIKIPIKFIFALLSSIVSLLFGSPLVYMIGNNNLKVKIDSVLNSLESHFGSFILLMNRIGGKLNISFLSNADVDTVFGIIVIIGLIGFVISGGLFVGLKLYKEVCMFFFHINISQPTLQLILYAIDLMIIIGGLYLVFAFAFFLSLYNTFDKLNFDFVVKSDIDDTNNTNLKNKIINKLKPWKRNKNE